MQHLLLRRIGPRTWVLEEEFKSECGITVPMGFVTDGLSVPIAGRWLVTPSDYGFNASVVHDYLLKEGYGWEYANERFEAQLVHDDVSPWRRTLYMWGVELWGGLKSIGE